MPENTGNRYMPDPNHDYKSKIATPKVPAIAFVCEHVDDIPLWTGHDFISLERFLDDMDALGFAIWETPSVIYVYCGRFS